MLKIIHTSDWHLGQRLIEKDRYQEHSIFLNWLSNFIKNNEIDALLITGDIFDTANPSAQALELYYSFLASLVKTNCNYIIILGGNHDSPSLLNAPKEYLKYNNIFVLGAVPENIEEQIIKIEKNNQKVIIAAVPFLRDRDIRKASTGEMVGEIETKIKTGIKAHYQQLADIITEKYSEDIPAIATGHLFIAGSSLSESEKDIHVGNLGAISCDIFPEVFNYVALGHIHKAQVYGADQRIRYSGSPIALSFSEAKQKKSFVLLEIENNAISQKLIEIPQSRRLIRLSGDILEITNSLTTIKRAENELPVWVDITLQNEYGNSGIYEQLREKVSPENCDVLNVKTDIPAGDAASFFDSDTTLHEITVDEVFLKLCETQKLDMNLEKNKEIFLAFKEILEEIN